MHLNASQCTPVRPSWLRCYQRRGFGPSRHSCSPIGKSTTWYLAGEGRIVSSNAYRDITQWRHLARFARAQAKIGMGAGLAVIIGPQFSKLIMRIAEPRYCCLLSTAFSATAALTIFLTFEETLFCVFESEPCGL